MLTQRYTDALTFAIQAHSAHTRKATGIPYISHPIAVSGLVLDMHGSEDEAIAALLHDTVEDNKNISFDMLRERFGDKATSIVMEVTDNKNMSWDEIKIHFRCSIPEKSDGALIVKGADLIHNASSLYRNYKLIDWSKFKKSPSITVGNYLETMIDVRDEVIRRSGNSYLIRYLDLTIGQITYSGLGWLDEIILRKVPLDKKHGL